MASESANEELASSAGTRARRSIAAWANEQDEWVRWLCQRVLQTGGSLSPSEVQEAHSLLRQEKGLDPRDHSEVGPLSAGNSDEHETERLEIRTLEEISGVNALSGDSVIEFHRGLTLLYGENGTGKTGFARILKAAANSRTQTDVLGDVYTEGALDQDRSATIKFTLGDTEAETAWRGEVGLYPFDRISVFDSGSVRTHLDQDLDYVVTPAVLALFEHVIKAIKDVEDELSERLTELEYDVSDLIGDLPRGSEAYQQLEVLGAATDLGDLRKLGSFEDDAAKKLESARRTVLALESAADKSVRKEVARQVDVLDEATSLAANLQTFLDGDYPQLVSRRSELSEEFDSLRAVLLEHESEHETTGEITESWQRFLEAGADVDEARQSHERDTCPYCRQPLSAEAKKLLARYSELLESEIREELTTVERDLAQELWALNSMPVTRIDALIEEYADRGDKPEFYEDVSCLLDVHKEFQTLASQRSPIENVPNRLHVCQARAEEALAKTSIKLEELKELDATRSEKLAEARRERDALAAGVRVAQNWSRISGAVRDAKEAARLERLKKPLPSLRREVTRLSKTASDELVNQSFDDLFAEECQALRAPDRLKLAFIGRQGQAKRRKSTGHRDLQPSLVLSEGEQKVIALADFLAESRLASARAPVVFDDPVSSLDHRRLEEVAERIAQLAESTQVVVFTHDILFTQKLLSLHERSKRCSYYTVSDEGESKGTVTPGSGPRWDSPKQIGKRIKQLISDAEQQTGESRQALIETAYSWVRSWCEVFVEAELLAGVAVRFRPNVSMGRLRSIDTEVLAEVSPDVTRIFEDACRYIPGHSQPLASLGTRPSLDTLKSDWDKLQEIRARTVS